MSFNRGYRIFSAFITLFDISMSLSLQLPRFCHAFLRFPGTNAGVSHAINLHKRAISTQGVTRCAATSRSAFDPEQARLFEEEQIVAVTFDDKPLKPISKRAGHENRKGPPLHRAFSVFLFDTQNRLLLQKRAPTKITFPNAWTNTCCSHPLWSESELGDDRQDPVLGCKRAAIRKLEHELGIPISSLRHEDFIYMSRIHYISDSGAEWGEHEIDYILLARKDVVLTPNENEVSETRYVAAPELKAMMRRAELHRGESPEVILAEDAALGGAQGVGGRDAEREDVRGHIYFTPWSRAIMERWLYTWWPDVGADTSKLEKHRDTARIHRIGRVD